MIASQRYWDGSPWARKAASMATISASGVEWDTQVCRLLCPAIG